MLRCFLSYYRRYRMLTGLLALGAILGALLELLFPWGVRHILQTELPSGEWNRILRWCFWLGMAYCLNFLLLFAVSWGSGILSAGMENDMRKDLFAHLQKLPFATMPIPDSCWPPSLGMWRKRGNWRPGSPMICWSAASA